MSGMKFTALLDKDNPIKLGKRKTPLKVYKKGGRGRKQCKNLECLVYVGAKTKVCPNCNYSFFQDKSPKKEPEKKKVSLPPKVEYAEKKITVKTAKDFAHIVITPAGKCPVPLKDVPLDKENICKWALALREWGLKQGDYLTDEAIVYYSRQTYGIFSPEFEIVRKIVEEWEASDEVW